MHKYTSVTDKVFPVPH